MEITSDSDEKPARKDNYNVWIITCKHSVEDARFIGVRLNTVTGSSLIYVTTASSWRQTDGMT